MTDDLRTTLYDLGRAFEAFKESNNERIRQMEQKGHADPLTEMKVNRLNGEISRAIDAAEAAKRRVDLVETALSRAPASKGDEWKEAETFMLERKHHLAQGFGVDAYRQYKQALRNYLRRNNAGSAVDEIKALAAGSDPDGGFAVTPDMSGRIAQLVRETSPMRKVANVVTIGTDALEGVNDLNEATSGWVGETEARSETTAPKIGEYRIPVHEQYAEPRATQKLLDDAMFNAEEWLAGQLVTGQSGAFASSNPEDALINLVYALKSAYRDKAVFMMKRSTLAAVRKLKDGDGNYLWQPDFQLKQGGTLLGFDVIEAEDMPAIAANSLSIAFGDFSAGYQIVDRQGVRILRDSFTAKPYVKFYTTKRTGGDVMNFEAIKLLKFSASQSRKDTTTCMTS